MSASIIAALLADKKNTRAALAAALAEANTEREALRAALSLVRVELASAKNALTDLGEAADDARANEHEGVNADHVADVVRKAIPVAWPAAPKAPRKLPPHFVAAREAAMRLGRVVRVGA
jgi:septal ring factor EnvC (AmiA/AmiB activator)